MRFPLRAWSSIIHLLLGLAFWSPLTGEGATLKKLLLIGQGPDGHPPASHEFMAGIGIIEKLLSPFQGLEISVIKADEPWSEGPGRIDETDAVVMYLTQGARWMQSDPKRYAALDRLAQRKGGIVALHWAVGAQDGQYIDGQVRLLGGSRGGPERKYKVLETDVRVADGTHPIMFGLRDFEINDEFYYRLDFTRQTPGVNPLLTVRIDEKDEPVCWAWERPAGGRSFGFVGLHFHNNWERVEYRRLVVQAILWTLDLSIPKQGVNVDLDAEALRLHP